MRGLLLVLCVGLLIVRPSHAQFMNGNELLEMCESNRAQAGGYITGVVDWEIMTSLSLHPDGKTLVKKRYLCVPTGVMNTQIIDGVCASLKSRPEDRHWEASMLVYNAAISMYPCKSDN